MATFRVKIEFTGWGYVEIDADSLEEAISVANGSEELPDDLETEKFECKAISANPTGG